MVNSIINYKEYGKIRLRLNELLIEKGVNRNQLAQRIGIRHVVIAKWCNNEVERMDLDVLARICFALDCEISDLIEYVNE